MSANPSTQPVAIQVTDSAALKVYELIQEEENLNLKLRVFITGGGCSGFQYGFSFDEMMNEDDFEITKAFTPITPNLDDNKVAQAAVKLLIDAQSFAYLKGAEIDYCHDLQGERFIIRNNPNTKTTCGCGSSFSIDD